ncbi:glycoside hydrolase family 2 protein [Serpula lacrymans var. lacrymans S7.9]|uniref:Beta-mannosidase B n=1 Tax=Serpula lacrymans var. lacrymans (strain S7.9) TaxID=578457 RepID=F8NMT9_SERL9|nr:glycoside hydrolase family 2 protein [Serpula lacrymans var. lacrymans S7.9]EGO27915.1 glycoside hydrolase family 2 protein [Serpula lacrymans var. lacrymans S7.9]
MSVIRPLTQNWTFTQVGGGKGTKKDEWLSVSQFPTTVHVELLKLKKIPDPFLGLNEWEVQWVGEGDWAFKNTFVASGAELATSNADLVFDGLDTFATVQLNGHKILQTENQFVSYRAPVKQYLQAGSNELLISFSSAFLKGRELEKQNGKLHLWNGDSSRLHVRKAQYNYGWDWGPVLMTIGPWKPVKLHTYNTHLTDVDVRSKVSESLDVSLSVDLSLSEKTAGSASVVLKNSQGATIVSESDLKTDSGSARTEFFFSPGVLDLWYPVGYGKQPLYTVEVQVKDKQGNVLDTKIERVSFRRVRVVQEPLVDQPGLTFLFEVNNIRVFCGGSNWIPADSFLTTLTADRYRAWLQLLVDGNQNMVRVWGGGIYEADAFYDTCDGIFLVWQDFMFGCGQYPAYDSFLKLVEVEAEQNVKRLRHHPSVVIFAGNNEDYQLAESIKIVDYSDETSDFRKTEFPARYIYERTLPSIVNKFCDIFYHRSSPYSAPGVVTTDKTLGDLHQWNVWHGSQEPWHNWDILAGRFVSEFGMEGYPNIRTVDYWLAGDKLERYPQSRVNNNHNKADGFERRLELYLVENFKHAFDMDSYVYYTQIMQAETLASAYRLWRRNWRGRGREHTAGALVWQINDCWPTTSWAIVDYFLRPKPGYFTIARELRPYTVGMTRKEKKTFANEFSAADFKIETILEIWGTNNSLSEKSATLEVTSFDLHSSWTDKWSKAVKLGPNASTELFSDNLPGQPVRTKQSEVPGVIIVSARLLDADGTVLGRYSNWPEPFKFITFPTVKELGLKISVSSDGESVQLSTQKPIKGIIMDVDGEDVKWSDQAIDLVPGDPQVVKAIGLKGREVKVRFLGDGSA